MKLKQLESALQQVETFKNPKLNYEQYITTPHLGIFRKPFFINHKIKFIFIASQILYSIDTQYDDINESLVCDLGVGTGMLSIGSSLMGADLVYGLDIDSEALAQCAENVNHFDLANIELINIDCKQLLKSYELNKKTIFRDFDVDTILMNPPFGTKYQSNAIFEKELVLKEQTNINKDLIRNFSIDSTLGIDMQFLKLASKIAKRSIYSLNKTCTRDFIKKFSSNLNLKMEVICELKYNIPKVGQNNKSRMKVKTTKPEKDIEVDFLRFSFI
jgi:rRNA N6-adenosine-methyltransferase METTL5